MSNCNKEYQIPADAYVLFEEAQACKHLADIYTGRMFGYKKAKKAITEKNRLERKAVKICGQLIEGFDYTGKYNYSMSNKTIQEGWSD